MYKSDYYMWLLDRIDALRGEHSNYSLLAQQLFSTEYTYAFELEKNRAMAGLNLRKLFAQEYGVYLEDVQSGPCSVLEMIIAISETIAFDKSAPTSKWFWLIMDNLGLTSQDDSHYDENYISDVLNVWLFRQYDSCGHGSLFPIPDYDGDVRNMETWDQMNVYLTRLYPAERF